MATLHIVSLKCDNFGMKCLEMIMMVITHYTERYFTHSSSDKRKNTNERKTKVSRAFQKVCAAETKLEVT